MRFDRVILIGSGKIACDCLNELTKYTKDITAVESEQQQLSMLNLLCVKKRIPFVSIKNKSDMYSFFTNINENTLVISANNNYIFVDDIVQKRNLEIINFHNALLPKYPGRNAPTWAIYFMEKESGITWHYINSGIDTGDIIIQKKVSLHQHITALELTRRCMELANEAFGEIIPVLLLDYIRGIKQAAIADRKVYRSTDIPSNGIVDAEVEFGKVYAFLRSMDYGKINIFPKPRIRISQETFEILSYKYTSSGDKNGYEMPDRHTIIITNNGEQLHLVV